MASREHYTRQSLAEASFTSATLWGSACPLTFTPALDADYVVFWNVEMVNRTSTLSDAKCRVTADGVAKAEFNVEYRAVADEYGGYSGFFKITGQGHPTTLNIEVQAETEGHDIRVRNMRITALKMLPGDAFAESIPRKGVVGGTNAWEDVCTLDFTPDAGDYLVLGHSVTSNYATTPPVYGRLMFDGVGDVTSRDATAGHAEVVGPPPNYVPLHKIWKRTVAASGVTRTVKWQGHSHNTGNEVGFAENRILVLKLSGFEANHYADLNTLNSHTAADYESTLSMTPNVSANPHLILSSWYIAGSNVSMTIDTQITDQGTQIANPIIRPYSGASNRGSQAGHYGYASYSSAGPRSYSLDIKSDGTNIAYGRPGSVIAVLDLGSSDAPTPTPVTVTAQTGSLMLVGHQPSVAARVWLYAGEGALTFTGHAPTVIGGKAATVNIGTGSLLITGFAPTVSVGRPASATVQTGNLSIMGHAPTVTAGKSANATVQTGNLELTSFAPSVLAGRAAHVVIGTGSLNLISYPASVSAGATAKALPGQLTFQGYAPTVEVGSSELIEIIPDPKRTIIAAAESRQAIALSEIRHFEVSAEPRTIAGETEARVVESLAETRAVNSHGEPRTAVAR